MTLRTWAARIALVSLLAGSAAVFTACGSHTEPADTVGSESPAIVSSAVEETGTVPAEKDPSGETLSLEGVYTNPDRDYQMTLPDGWIEDKEKTNVNTILYLSPNGNRAVEIKRQKADPNLLAYTEADFKKTYAASFKDFKLLEYKRVKANGIHGIRLYFTCKENGRKYTVVQFLMAGEYDYNITWSALDGNKDFFRFTVKSVLTLKELDPDQNPADRTGRLYERTYTDAENRYAIKLPKNWKVSSQKDDQVLFVPADKKTNINIQCKPIDEQLFRYKKSYFTSYFQKAFGKTAAITKFSKTKINGVSALYLEVRYNYNQQNLTSCQYLINKGDYTYSVTYTAPTNGLSTKAFTDSAKTFKLK